MFLMWNVSFFSLFRKRRLRILLWLASTDPFTLELQMKMNEEGLNDECTLDERWAQIKHKRFVNTRSARG